MVHKYMAGPNVDGPFLALLKHTGTSTGKGQFVFKTGSMDTVRSISGIVQTAGGQNLAVTIMVNDHIQSVKNLRNAFNDLIGLLNQITSIGFITVKPAIGGDKPVPAETKAVVEMTHASASTGSHSSPHRRRKHD
jgi:hypothetical protein